MAAASAAPAAGAIVFDLDGVLVDVRRSFRAAVVRTVAALGGGGVAEDEIQGLKNAGGFNNDWDLSRELLRRRGVAVGRERVIEVFNDFYLGPGRDGNGLIQEEDWLLPPALLRALACAWRLAIFTGRPRADAEFVLNRFGLRACFEPLLGLEDVSAGKPHPEGLERLRRHFAPLPLVAYIGDTVDDARCAAAAGVPFHAVLAPGQAAGAELAALFSAAGCQRICADVASTIRPWLNGAAGASF